MVCIVDLAEPKEACRVIGVHLEDVLLEIVGLIRKEVKSKLVVEAHRVREGKATIYGIGYQLRVGLWILF